MSPRFLVVSLFRILALILGIPSLAATLYFGWATVRMRLLDPGPLPASSGSSNQIAAAIETTARAAGTILQWLGGLGEWLVTMILVVSAGLFLFALLLWFTASGLAQGKAWARVMAVFCGLAFASLLGIAVALRSMTQ